MIRVTVDRLEDEVAVLVAGGTAFELPRALLPGDAAEGDVLALDLRRDEAATEAARTSTAARRARLARDDDGGDFSL